MNKSHDTKSDSLQQCFVSQTDFLKFLTNYQIYPSGTILKKNLIFKKTHFKQRKIKNVIIQKQDYELDNSHLSRTCLTLYDPLLALPFNLDSLLNLSGI